MRVDVLRIGTRGSRLALRQTEMIANRIKDRYPKLSIEIVPIKTQGDRMQNISLVKIGGKGVFVKEIEEALLSGDIHCAVHSMKDVPTEIPDGLNIQIIAQREDPRDVLISRDNKKLESLPRGARIGTGSLRRGMQLLNCLPDCEIVAIRGNLDTRIKKISTEELDGVILAAAGLKRMGWHDRVSQYIPVELMIPAAGQGAVGVETREEDNDVGELLAFINHEDTMTEVSSERAFLQHLGGGCQVPIAAFARKTGEFLILKGVVGTIDGRRMIFDEVKGSCDDWKELGKSMAENILSKGGRAILAEVYKDI
ncbi:MAG: hydroxymethylbilane synthase [Deltaproteobacteria bacterium]|nr:hydroxymethylbilane synthase [Deltaproteobacteria bacterium]